MNTLPDPVPAVAAARRAVRLALQDVTTEEGSAPALVLVALSGGADSLALAVATAAEAPRLHLRAGAIVVDHGLQEGSDAVAERAAEQARSLGLEPVLVRRVRVTSAGGGSGPEAAAREARYRAFAEVAAETGAAAILTAHTRDDQAEQVILSLARGSGLRSLAGIPPERSLPGGAAILRPFLARAPEITRAQTERVCAAAGLTPWSDPHNDDPSFARVRVRTRALPMLERELGPGVAAALARTADLAREDAEALDAMAEDHLAALLRPGEGDGDGHDTDSHLGEATLPVDGLSALPAALRQRVIRLAARRAFGAQLSREHTLAVAALITDWHGQGPINVPGLVVTRAGGALRLRGLR